MLNRVYRHTRLMPSHQAKVRGNESSIIHIDDSHINQYCAVSHVDYGTYLCSDLKWDELHTCVSAAEPTAVSIVIGD